MFAKIAVNIPTDRNFTYAIPGHLESAAVPGKRVLIPFGKRIRTGYLIETLQEAEEIEIKPLHRILDAEPLFTAVDLQFYQWLASYYLQPLGRVLAEALPAGINPRTERFICASTDPADSGTSPLTDTESCFLDILNRSSSGISWKQAKRLIPEKSLDITLKSLQQKGLILFEERVNASRVVGRTEKRFAACTDPLPAGLSLTARQRELLNYISESGESTLDALRKQICYSPSLLTALRRKGCIRIVEREFFRTHAGPLPRNGLSDPPELNSDQRQAAESIRRMLSRNLFSACLLHGVTGSGKTEVYLNAIAESMQRGGGVLCLVPEISLTTQIMQRIRNRFPGLEVAVWHSDISDTLRYDIWRRCLRGEIQVVVGARSAVFVPVKNLKLVIVDEEHDGSYKQDERTRYNGRDAAVMRAKLANATVILGSATPGLQTYYHARSGKHAYLNLPERVGNRPLPRVDIISMVHERTAAGNVPVLSAALSAAMAENLAGGGQTLLFLNRRGFNTFLYCPDCRQALSCPHCTVSLTYHSETGRLHCHYCDHQTQAVSLCPSCGGRRVFRYGTGTERLEEEVRRLFPKAVIGRMDRDAVSRRGSRERILERLESREIDVLVGTQMITKGHDFPHITLVGVICADLSLNIPDFRAAEKTFQLLTQVAGRSGRGEAPGRVIIQTLNPDHYAIARAGFHDYASFFEDEIALRQAFAYPPFTRMITLHLSALDKAPAEREMAILKETLKVLQESNRYYEQIAVIGPTRAPIETIRGRHRWQIILKGREIKPLHGLARTLIEQNRSRTLQIAADVDPLNFM